MENENVIEFNGQKFIYEPRRPVEARVPAVSDVALQGWALKQMVDRDLATGPSRAMNPRPAAQPEGYRLADMVPQSVIDASVAQASEDSQRRQEEKRRLVESGGADHRIKGVEKVFWPDRIKEPTQL